MRYANIRYGAVLGALAWVFLTVGTILVARAQQAAADGPRFTGNSESLETEGLRISRRHFDAGARSAWHRHPFGQLLFVESGRARTRERGGPLVELGVGESVYTAPNVEHWHGAAPETPFRQVAVGFGEGIEWLELVTDAEYEGR